MASSRLNGASSQFFESAQGQKAQSDIWLEKGDHYRLRAAASVPQHVGLYDEARMAYLEAANADPNNTMALYSAAMEYLRIAEFTRAGKLINAVLKIDEAHNQSPNPYALVAHAACLIYARQKDEASGMFSRLENITGMREIIDSLKKSAKAARYVSEDVSSRRCPAYILDLMDKNFRKNEVPDGQMQAALKSFLDAFEVRR